MASGRLLAHDLFPEPARDDLVARWLHMTREALPALAGARDWPIRRDHCFMRVLLDAAVGDRWDRHVRRPAVRHLDAATLARAVALAERALAEPGLIPELNRASLARRRAGG